MSTSPSPAGPAPAAPNAPAAADPWAPPPAQPGRHRKAIAVAAVLAVGTLLGTSVGVGLRLTAPVPRYKLVTPDSVLGGSYRLSKSSSEQYGKTPAPFPLAGIAGATTDTTGYYIRPADGSVLVLRGSYGRLHASHLLLGLTLALRKKPTAYTTTATPFRSLLPSGSHAPVSCEVLSYRDPSRTVPLCIWADNSAIAEVVEFGPESLADPTAIDLQAFADQVGAIRDEVRGPAD